MSALQRAAQARTRQPIDGVWEAVITETASDAQDLVGVVIPAFDASLVWGPCRWMARDATSVPAKGNRALVAFDENQHPTIIYWDPFT